MSHTVLIIDDEDNFCSNVGEYLNSIGYDVLRSANLEDARGHLKRGEADVVLLDVQLPDGYGPNLLQEITYLPYRPPVIMITGFGDIEMAVEAMKNGASDFLTKPIHFPRLKSSLERACEIVDLRRELQHLRSSQQPKFNFIVGKSPLMGSLLSYAERAASALVSVLITGETGTGKEVLAQYVHKVGPRSKKPFIDINCAAIQSTVLESELFGYEAGAFTGADHRKPGLMEIADGGILFLDEISSMPLDIQAKLLRAIEEKSFRRVGGTNLIRVDVQVVAASNRDLEQMIAENSFRGDLYFRLKVVDLHLPPLRERKEDIPELVAFFIRTKNAKLGKNVAEITPEAMSFLRKFNWPGNIRELSHVIERAVLFCDEEMIDVNHLPSEILHYQEQDQG